MGSQDREGAGGLSPGVMMLIAAVFGVLLYRGPSLEPARPKVSEPGGQNCAGCQNVDARLWEDPFEASARATEKQRTELSNIDFKGMGEGRNRLDIVGVILNGKRYVGASETRRRTRYAVISALHTSGCDPVDSLRIGIAVASLKHTARGPGCDPSGDSPLLIPFEVFQKPGDDGESVCVLWIDESVLGECPLQKLRSLLRANPVLKTFLDDDPWNSDERIRMKFIGPESLSTLENMLHEIRLERAANTDVPECSFLFKSCPFYSPTVSAENEVILHHVPRDQETVPVFLSKDDPPYSAFRGKAGFFRLTSNDRALSKAMVEELKLRGVDLSSSDSHVILLSEWDTRDARALRNSFQQTVALVSGKESPSWIHPFAYPRGLDGLTVDAVDKKKGDGGNSESGKESGASVKNSDQSLAPSEAAEGNDQFDYLRRFVMEIRHLENYLARKGERIKAVVLLGTDVYDKILVLKALRPYFPGAVFCTTDLDALFLSQQDLKWTRNLVVVSGFGFQLHPELQGQILPFRSSRQTAQYFATLAALNAPIDALRSIDEKGMSEDWLKPRVFEIGRTRAIDLSPDDPGQNRKLPFAAGSKKAALAGLHPEKPNWHRNSASQYVGILLLLLLLAGLSQPNFWEWSVKTFNGIFLGKGRENPGVCRPVKASAAAVLILAGIGFVVAKVYETSATEPFFWMEGVSVWPTEIIRAIGLFLAVYFLWSGSRDLQENIDTLSERIGISKEKQKSGGSAEDKNGEKCFQKCKRRLKEYRKILSCKLTDQDNRKSEKKGDAIVKEIWENYLLQSKWNYRLIRVLAPMLVYLIMGGSLIRIFGIPYTPIRSNAHWLDTLFLLPAVIAFIFLLFFVMDATRLCNAFAKNLTGQTIWPYHHKGFYNPDRWGFMIPEEPVARVESSADRKMYNNFLDVEFFTRLSEPVMKLIYYPFIILALMIVARLQLFDRWETPVGLYGIFALAFLCAVYCAVSLRLTAEKIRRANLGELNDLHIKLKRGSQSAGVDKLELIIRRIETMQEGAFAPFRQQPVVKALLLPFGSAGGAFLLDYIQML